MGGKRRALFNQREKKERETSLENKKKLKIPQQNAPQTGIPLRLVSRARVREPLGVVLLLRLLHHHHHRLLFSVRMDGFFFSLTRTTHTQKKGINPK